MLFMVIERFRNQDAKSVYASKRAGSCPLAWNSSTAGSQPTSAAVFN
jgi:hypothetical protein